VNTRLGRPSPGRRLCSSRQAHPSCEPNSAHQSGQSRAHPRTQLTSQSHAPKWIGAESANSAWDYVPVYDNLRYTILPNGSLAIANVTQREQGYYMCSAKNGFGPEVTKLIKITVHGECLQAASWPQIPREPSC